VSREPLVLLGMPLERPAVERPITFAGCCMAAFVVACYVLGAIFDNGSL
jgi:hypothetical protein